MEKLKQLDGNTTYFMSDLHIGHENILNFCGRPFSTADDCEEYILNRLKTDTKEGDTIIDLGDMFWKKSSDFIDKFFDELKGREFIKVLGNHDKVSPLEKTKSLQNKKIYDILEVNVLVNSNDLVRVFASHYPVLCWNGKNHGSIHVFGHCHGNIDSWVDSNPELMVDVGFDGKLAKKLGTFIIPFQKIYKEMIEKAGSPNFREYAKRNYTLL